MAGCLIVKLNIIAHSESKMKNIMTMLNENKYLKSFVVCAIFTENSSNK